MIRIESQADITVVAQNTKYKKIGSEIREVKRALVRQRKLSTISVQPNESIK